VRDHTSLVIPVILEMNNWKLKKLKPEGADALSRYGLHKKSFSKSKSSTAALRPQSVVEIELGRKTGKPRKNP
jgi:hypothetical protein